MDNDFKNKKAGINTEESILGLVVYSPIIYFLLFLVGFVSHLYYPIYLPKKEILMPVGFILIFIAPLLIFWAQHSIKKFVAHQKEGNTIFHVGPYKYSRNPTYLGLALLTLGFSFVSLSFMVLVSTIVSFHIVNFFVVKKEEELMHKKYGEDYTKYKTDVRTWL